jgi:urease
LIGGGTGPNTGSNATTCTPGAHHVEMMMKATDDIPLNFGFTGKGSCAVKEPLVEQIRAGCLGLKIHEDWSAAPTSIDTCLQVCDEYDVQVFIN